MKMRREDVQYVRPVEDDLDRHTDGISILWALFVKNNKKVVRKKSFTEGASFCPVCCYYMKN